MHGRMQKKTVRYLFQMGPKGLSKTPSEARRLSERFPLREHPHDAFSGKLLARRIFGRFQEADRGLYVEKKFQALVPGEHKLRLKQGLATIAKFFRCI